MDSKIITFSLRFTVFCLYFLFFLTADCFAQYTKYWIQFTDKNNNPFNISSPSAFLSSRAIQRRQNQGIAVVQNDLPITPMYYDSVKNVPNVTILNRSKWFNAVTVYTTDPNALNTIANFSFVADTQSVQRYHRQFGIEEKSFSPVANLIPKVLGTEMSNLASYSYGPSFNQVDMIGGVCMHNQGFDGAGMIIAVMDAGFYKVDSLPIFDSLRTNGQILGTWDFVDNDTLVYDSHTHGTMVLSTMGGNIPGMIIGTAPKAKYWLFRTEEAATEYVIEEDNWVAAAEYADSVGADIFNTSLGYTEFDDTTQNHTYADMDGNTTRISIASDIAASKGIIPVCSAGNSGGSPWNFIGAPADADSALAIGAVDSLRNYAWFSSNGPTYDGRIKPNVAAQGQDAVVADPMSGGIVHLSGTSFASPITAGMVACLWQAHPASTNMQIFNAIEQTASQFSAPDTLLGYGISDFCAANLILSVLDNTVSSEDVLHVYPNPFTESAIASLQGIKVKECKLSIFDLLGNLVYQQSIHSQLTAFNPKISAGVYVLQVKDGNRNYSAKLIKY